MVDILTQSSYATCSTLLAMDDFAYSIIGQSIQSGDVLTAEQLLTYSKYFQQMYTTMADNSTNGQDPFHVPLILKQYYALIASSKLERDPYTDSLMTILNNTRW